MSWEGDGLYFTRLEGGEGIVCIILASRIFIAKTCILKLYIKNKGYLGAWVKKLGMFIKEQQQ
jgi:hypothetical protein